MLLVLLVALAHTGCAPDQSPEQQVRDVIAAGESAAERREVGELMDLVSAQYADEEGRDAATLEQYVRGYLLIHPSIHLLTRIESIDFPYADMARVRVTVGSLAREAPDPASLDLAADVEELDIELVREDDTWRVRRASRAR
jgi:hypothetical protein